ncbi:MAG: 30S ribosomal protein S6 [Candidatus Aureabacteria bacterium]|nr:30S ribosomal protein S6 [Candidatus Auribacterota bacterium]
MKLYEGMFLINPELDENGVQNQVETIKNEIIREKGEIQEVHVIGRRKMAYSIEKQSHAVYVLLYFKVDPEAVDTLRRRYHLDQNILRELVFLKDKKLPLNEIKD